MLASVSGEVPSAGAEESGREGEDLFFEEGSFPCAERHETTGGSALGHAGGSTFAAAHARKSDHRASCVAALSLATSTPTRSSDTQPRRSTHLDLLGSAVTHASTTFSAAAARAASVRVPSRKESDMLSQRSRESIIQELKRDHKRICLSMDELLRMEDDEAKAKRLSKPVASAIGILVGIFGIMQVGINTTLKRVYVPSALAASATSFCVGSGVMLIITTLHKFPRGGCSNGARKELRSIPWYAYTGGLLGAAYVTTTILIAPVLGFAAFKIAAVSGQLISGIICDAVGFLHLSSSPPTPFRMLCTVFVLLGAILCAKWSESNGNEWQVPVYLLLSALAGSVFPIQACVNYELGRHLGTPYRAVAANFIIGAFALWVCVAIEYAADPNASLPIYQPQEGETMHWWAWTGGIFGALLICGITLGIPALGAVGFTLIFVSTQLVAAVVADAIGAFGYTVVPLDAYGGRRIVGATLAILAAAAFRLSPPSWLSCLNSWPCQRFNKGDTREADLDDLDLYRTNVLSNDMKRSSFIARVPLDELRALKERRRSTAADSGGGESDEDEEEYLSTLQQQMNEEEQKDASKVSDPLKIHVDLCPQ